MIYKPILYDKLLHAGYEIRANAIIKNGSHFAYSHFFFAVSLSPYILPDPEASSMQL